MENYSIEQLAEINPTIKEIIKYTIITTIEDMKKIVFGPKIYIDGIQVSIEFLKRILQDDKYFTYAYKYFTNENKGFYISYITNNKLGKLITYEKIKIIKGLDILILTSKISLSSKEQQRLDILKDCLSYDKFLEQMKNNSYVIDIEGKKYSFPIAQLLFLIELSEEELNELLNDDSIKTIDGIPKEYLIYASYQFIKNKILNNYLIPESIKNRLNQSYLYQKIDFEAINKLLKTEDTKYKEAKINPELEKAVFSEMPEDMEILEKAIYIYIKMCKLLSYDEEYYALNQKGAPDTKHRDINYISKINLSNNKVVCYEFNLIYSKFLDKLGIKFKSHYKNKKKEDYGNSHVILEFRSNKFLVYTDAISLVLKADLINAKLNQPLQGLVCLNHNQKTKQEFQAAVSRVYRLIEQNQKVERIESFEEIIKEYENTKANIYTIGIKQKLSIMIKKIQSSKLQELDSLGQLFQLKDIIFTKHEQNNNIIFSIIRNNNPQDATKEASANVIITSNPINYNTDLNRNTYYFLDSNKLLITISKEELQERFDNGVFEYIELGNTPKIPGIIEKGRLKR